MVGTGRFELPTPRTPSECSTRLSHVPTQCSRSAEAGRLLGSLLVYTALCPGGITAPALPAHTPGSHPRSQGTPSPRGSARLAHAALPPAARNKNPASARPAGESACARTPDPPAARSSIVSSGTSRCSDRQNSTLLYDRLISSQHILGYRAKNRQNPRYVSVSARSRRETSVCRYPSRANASTAFGPHSTPP